MPSSTVPSASITTRCIDCGAGRRFYGGAVREVRNDYDTLGNLTHVWVDNLLTEENQYGTSGGGLPHALTQQTRGNLVTTASYDERGRQKRFGLRDISQYTSFDLPKTLTINGQAATLAYDAAGTRAKKTGPAGTTIYVDKLYERRESSGSGRTPFSMSLAPTALLPRSPRLALRVSSGPST